MSCYAIIPARGGSKRIPRKNVKIFHGRPIISYSIRTCIETEIFKKVIVSTEDNTIAKIAKEHGAEVPFLRSIENASDHASTLDVLKEVLMKLTQGKDLPEWIVCMYPTSALIKSETLKSALKAFKKADCNVMMSVLRFSHPPQRGFSMTNNSINVNKEFMNKRTQDIDQMYHDAGCFYVFRTQALLNMTNIWNEAIYAFELDEFQSQDIDNISDWTMAEMKYSFSRRETI